MRISDIRHQEVEGGLSEVSATLLIRKPRPETFRVWFRGPEGCFGSAPAGDILFAGYWIPAMFLEEELVIEGELSQAVVEAAYTRLEPVLLRWFRHELRPAPVAGASILETATPASPGVGCMFSGGLDSMYTLMRNRDSITHLAYVQGFDIAWSREDVGGRATRELGEVARKLGKSFILLRTNASEPLVPVMMRSRELGKSGVAIIHDMQFGSGLVALSFCLRGILGRNLIASSWAYEHPQPRGSHPLIEPSWSTPTMHFHLDGCEADRIDKSAWLLEHAPEALEHLRVCLNPPSEGAANCGRCSKCLRTLMELRVAGAREDNFSAFARRFDPELAMQTPYIIGGEFIGDIHRKAKQIGDTEIVRVTDVLLGERIYWPRLRKRLTARARQWLSPEDPRSRKRSRKRKSRS